MAVDGWGVIHGGGRGAPRVHGGGGAGRTGVGLPAGHNLGHIALPRKHKIGRLVLARENNDIGLLPNGAKLARAKPAPGITHHIQHHRTLLVQVLPGALFQLVRVPVTAAIHQHVGGQVARGVELGGQPRRILALRVLLDARGILGLDPRQGVLLLPERLGIARHIRHILLLKSLDGGLHVLGQRHGNILAVRIQLGRIHGHGNPKRKSGAWAIGLQVRGRLVQLDIHKAAVLPLGVLGLTAGLVVLDLGKLDLVKDLGQIGIHHRLGVGVGRHVVVGDDDRLKPES